MPNHTTSRADISSTVLRQRRAPKTAELHPQSSTAPSITADSGDANSLSADREASVEKNQGSTSKKNHNLDWKCLSSTKNSLGGSIYVEETAGRKSTSSVSSTSRIPDSYHKSFLATTRRRRESQEKAGRSEAVGISSSGNELSIP